jgi:hypothetical protein
VSADGEFQASQKLASDTKVMADTPTALQLRLLQTIVEVAAEKNSTLVLPFPVELLRFLDQATTGLAQPSSIRDPVPVEGAPQQTSGLPASTHAPPAPELQTATAAKARPLDWAGTPPA